MDAGLGDGAVSVHAADAPGGGVRHGRRQGAERQDARVYDPR